MTDASDISDDDDRIIAAEYVLGLLPAADRREAEARLNGDPAFRAAVAAWAEDFVAMTDDWPEVVPPAAVWAGIEAKLAEQDGGTGFLSLLRRPKSLRGLFGYAAGGLVAAGLAWVVLNSGVMTPAAPEFQARIAAEDESVVFAAAYDVDTGALEVLQRSGAAAPGRSLEFWLIAEGQAPVSVLVWPNGSERESVVLPADLAARLPNAVLAISDEPEGGSPTGAPTGDVLAVGPVESI
ncbi:anti-sigma factor [Pseudooceanicola atlanticus]|uniref:Regulator of SigK n=1 Tax=Pseudooceanicola atlanticus TaxID=1461694 RepID=A0A0A0ECA9_9RHOB|nr:anti-sigma factor [Pseudooceanicola atlanticus]KGM48591.1 hypothetical protein ATO9_13270 [Pseudooceanicola atlanticus]